MADEAALLNAVVLSMGEGVVVVDAESNLLMLNPATERLLPGGVEWLTGNRRVQGATVTMADRQTLIPLEDLPVARALRGERTDDLDVMVPGTGEDGPCLRLSGWPMRDADGAVTGAVLTLRDVTDRLRERESAGEAEERFRLTFEDAPVGIALVAVGESGGELLQVNRALAALTGRSVDELTGLDIQELVADEDADREATLRARLLSGEMSSSEQELRFKGANGLVWVQASSSVVRDARGRARYAIVQLRDASQRKRFEERLQHLADHDSLTGLLNRRRLQDELVAHEQRCRRFGAAGSLLLLDLDGFKDVNDTLGHLVGDQVLRNVAAVLAERLRETDAVARLGGDEFAILLPRTEQDAALALATELTHRVQTSSGAGVQWDVHVTASVGVAPFAGDDAGQPRHPGRGRRGPLRGEGEGPRTGGPVHPTGPAAADRHPPHLGPPHPRGPRGGPVRAARPADLRLRRAARDPARAPAAAAHGRRLPRLTRRVPAGGRALRHDPRDRQLGAAGGGRPARGTPRPGAAARERVHGLARRREASAPS